MDLGSYLKQHRAKANLSQAYVAHRLGYTTSQFISNWERGVSRPPINALKKLGVLYGISPEEVFNVCLQSTVAKVTADLKRKFNSSRAA